jgi:DNA-binding transcriptional ArsR family regulator
MGPIPMEWLEQAGCLPGRALHVGISIWHWHFIKKERTITLSIRKLVEIGVKRGSAYRALSALEEAGLISVERHVGRSPRVTLNVAQ